MKKKICDIGIITICLAIVFLFFMNGFFGSRSDSDEIEASAAVITQTVVATPTPALQRIEASYTGKTVTIGEKFDRSELLVTAHYDNGSFENVTDYTVSNEVITQTGLNSIVVMYRDMTTKAFIYGRQLISISVTPKKVDYGVGNMPDSSDLTVTGRYSDGAVEMIDDEFEISPERLEEPGKQEITVSYEGVEATCEVVAYKWDSIIAMNVSCNKAELFTNTELKKSDFTVMVVYSDLSTERVSTFTLSRDMFFDSGKQPITISYGGVSRSIDVNVVERYVVGLRAEYTGGVVVVGRKFRSDNMHVYVKYVDGEEVETKEYTVHNRKIRYIGNNLINVYYGDKFSAEVIIEGTEYVKPNFDYAASETATVGDLQVKVDTAIPLYLEKNNCVVLEALEKKTMKKAYRRLGLKKGKYISFNYSFADDNNEFELPLSIRVTIPEGFDMDHTFLYFCPNKKTVLGRMNKIIINDRTFECTLFKVGTYMLVYSDELSEEEEM